MVLRNLLGFWSSAATAVVPWAMLLLLLLQPLPVAADCECGYSTTTSGSSDLVFADLLESDFTRVDYFGDGYKGSRRWARQAFTKSAGAARGPFGEAYVTGNAMSDISATATTKNRKSSSDNNNDSGAGAGLELLVGGKVVDGMVQNAEVATTELDYFYGTYRVGLKVTDVPGTCTAFFWYFNDTQEIDIEFLSHEFNHANQSYPVNLVLQTAQSRAAGYDASGSGTGTFQKHDLPFDPTAGFHEYRFDFLADRVVFYADGAVLATMTGGEDGGGGSGGIPSRGGNLLLSHWSNGNPGWSAGPPAADARSVVSYVKAYFNSSDAAHGGEARSRCEKAPAGGNRVCKIPEGNRGFFFSEPGSGDGQGSGTGANGQGNGGGDGHHSAAGLPVATAGRLVPLVLTVALGATIWIAGQ
ncbi:glycoside hydrolase family 16 protein [Apiospora marii]|uniref:Glycoside hydrolase family 16 protein n=1 Tax=Apiospora marii TaxID=335849 RepID=A0ABR1RGE4_9PEZI